MTLEEKIQHLRTSSIEDARIQANSILDEYKISLEQAMKKHENSLKAQAKKEVQAELNHAKQELNKEIAKSQIDLKHKLNKCQKQLKRELFEEVSQLLDDFMHSEKYTEFLKSHIQEALVFAKGEPITIYINPSDKDKKDQLEKSTGAKLTISTEDFLGGIRAVIRERNILIDHSFKSGLNEAQDTFHFAGGNEQ